MIAPHPLPGDDVLRCPKCGCNDIDQRPARNLWGVPSFRCECDFCGARFEIEDPAADEFLVDYAIEFHRNRCPRCQSTNVGIDSTRRKAGQPTIRYHSCGDCKKPFKSIESAG